MGIFLFVANTHVVCFYAESCSRPFLDFHHHGIQGPEVIGLKDYMVGAGGKLRLAGIEHCSQVPTLPENVPHPSALARVPAILGAEAPHLAIQQGLVQLVLQGCSSE